MTYATKSGGSMGHAKPGETKPGTAGAMVGGTPNGMRQDFKQTGEIDSLKASGTPDNRREPVAPTAPAMTHNPGYSHGSSHKGSSHKGNPY